MVPGHLKKSPGTYTNICKVNDPKTRLSKKKELQLFLFCDFL